MGTSGTFQLFPFGMTPRYAYLAMVRILADCRKSIEKTKKEIKVGYEFGELTDMKWYLLEIIPNMEWKTELLIEASKCYGLPG